MPETWAFNGVTLYRAELDHYLNDPGGEVGKYLSRRGKLMLAGARRQVGVDTGLLRASLKMVHARVGRYQELRIGSDLRYALDHHEGTRQHYIRGHQMLRFVAGGRQIYTHQVLHPGTKPNHYLSDQLMLVRV